MGAMDAMRDTLGGDISPDIALVLAFFVLAAIAFGFVNMLVMLGKHPATIPLVLGALAFFPIALTRRPWTAFAVLVAGIIITSVIHQFQESRDAKRAARKAASNTSNDGCRVAHPGDTSGHHQPAGKPQKT